jgi:predicted lipoprotein with Yx(FWY)xxD motif
MRSKHITALTVAVMLAVAGVTAPGAGAGERAQAGARVTAKSSRFGKVLFDGRGYALYLFGADGRKRSTCYGACAKAWPPFFTKSKPVAGPGVRAGLLGTTRRRDGRLQVTYAGHPLYYYVDDGRGEIKCQNVSEFGGLWLVVAPNGKAVR